MALVSEFIPLQLDQLHREAAVLKTEGWRFIQTHAVNTDAGIDLYYSFMKDGKISNYRIEGIQNDQAVPSITDLFLAAFVFENEARELFGVDMRDIAIDFSGAMYAPAEHEPMTFMSVEQKAAREKAKKTAEAKEAQVDEPAAVASAGAGAKRIFVMTPERRARLDAKLATMSPEKVAKVEAALKAREAEAAAAQAPSAQESDLKAESQAPSKESGPQSIASEAAESAIDAVLESKLASMDPQKAAKVRSALAAKSGQGAAVQEETAPTPEADADKAHITIGADRQLETLINLMEDAKARIVRNALNLKGGE